MLSNCLDGIEGLFACVRILLACELLLEGIKGPAKKNCQPKFS